MLKHCVAVFVGFTLLTVVVGRSVADCGSCGPTYTGNGLSSLTDAKAAGTEAAKKAKAALGDQKAALVLVYDGDGVMDKAAVAAGVTEVFDASIVYGCPGYGPITQDGNEGTVGVLAVADGYAAITATLAKRDGDHAACGKQIGESLKAASEIDAPGKLLLLFGDCHVPADDKLVKGACSVLGEKFPAIGGASKGGSVYYQGKLVPNANVGIMITGDFQVGLSLKKDMSPKGLITSATDAVNEAMGDDKDHVALVFAFDCGGRRGELGPNAPKELAAMKKAAGKTPIFGFYGSGEIGHPNNDAPSCGVGYSISVGAIIVKD